MLARPATETQITHRRRLWLYVLVGLIVLFLIAPSLLVVPLSFSDSRYLTFPPPAWSTRWYQAYFTDSGWIDATWFSVQIAVMVTIASAVIGTMASIALVRGEERPHTCLGDGLAGATLRQ